MEKQLENGSLPIEMRGDASKDLQAITSVLSEDRASDAETHVTGDPLADKWERELAEGKVPDLTEKMK